MSHPELEPLDDDLAGLLNAERERPSASREAQGRVLASLSVSLGVPIPGGGAPPAPPPPAVPPAAAGSAGSVGAAKAAVAAAGTASLFKPILVGVAFGVLTSGVLIARPGPTVAPPVPVVSTVPAGSAPLALAPSIPAGPAADPRLALTAAPAASAAVKPMPSGSGAARDAVRDQGLAAEREILDEAQRALSSSGPAAALAALERHQREFPGGRLSQEREALTIRALARAGRMDEARARAAQFRAAHPDSLFLPVVESAAPAIP